jgi:hypothetical protein
MNTEYAQSPDLTTPMRDFATGVYWESMYNDGNMSDVYPCPWGQPKNPAGGKTHPNLTPLNAPRYITTYEFMYIHKYIVCSKVLHQKSST